MSEWSRQFVNPVNTTQDVTLNGLDKVAPNNPGAMSFLFGPRTLNMDNLTFWDKLMGGVDQKTGKEFAGFGSGLLDIGKTGLNAWLGFKQLGHAEDALDFQKKAFSQQFENQRKLTNAQLADRQRARVHHDPNTSLSVDDYMKKYGV